MLLQASERATNLFIVRFIAGIFQNFAMADDAVAIDDEDGTLGDVHEPDHVGIDDAICVDDRFVEVAEKRKGESLGIRPSFEREERVRADADDIGRTGD